MPEAIPRDKGISQRELEMVAEATAVVENILGHLSQAKGIVKLPIGE